MSVEITRIVETSLYVHDLATSEKFYTDVLKLRLHSRAPGRDVSTILVISPLIGTAIHHNALISSHLKARLCFIMMGLPQKVQFRMFIRSAQS